MYIYLYIHINKKYFCGRVLQCKLVLGSLELDQPQPSSSQKENRYVHSSLMSGKKVNFNKLLL